MDNVFIITTRNYPKNWETAFYQKIGLESLDQSIEGNNDDFYLDADKKSIIKHRLIKDDELSFHVYVAPCCKNNEKADICYSYLNGIVDQVYQGISKKNNEFNVFLIAHDRDFGVHQNDVVATIEVPDNYGKLQELRKIYHIFLFQHEVGDIYDCVKFIPKTVPPIFDIDKCKGLLNILNEKITRKKR